jgi:hypothetical protein
MRIRLGWIAITVLAAVPMLLIAHAAAAEGPRPAADDGTWAQSTEGMCGGFIEALAVSPGYAGDQTLFAATRVAVFRSTTGGSTWTSEAGGVIYGQIKALAISPGYAADHTAYAGVAGAMNPGVRKSTDGGESWQLVNEGLTERYVYALSISPDYTTDQTLFAGTGGGGVFNPPMAPAPGVRSTAASPICM